MGLEMQERPKKKLLHAWVTTRCKKCQDRLLLVLGRDREFLVAIEFFLVLCHDRNNCVDMVSDFKP